MVTTLSAAAVGAAACVGYGGCPPFGLPVEMAVAAGLDVNAPFTDILRNLSFLSLSVTKSPWTSRTFSRLNNSRYSRRTSAVTFTAFVRLRISNRTNVASTLEPSKWNVWFVESTDVMFPLATV